MTEDKLERLLNIRKVPDLPPDLVSRIINTAGTRPRNVSVFKAVMEEITGFLVIPRPAYWTAACLLLGLAAGYSVDIAPFAMETTIDAVFVLETENVFL